MNKSMGLLSVLASLLIPISWGLGLYFLFCTALESRWLDHELLRRYVLGHPVSKITTAMLCVGVAALVQTLLDCLHQLRTQRLVKLTAPLLGASPVGDEGGAQEVDLAAQLSLNLDKLSKRLHGHILFRRLKLVLAAIGRNGASEASVNEMRHLAEEDAVQWQQRHSLVRILIWATPMLGFLGTVMGISQALGNLNIGPDNDLQTMMGGLQSSLYVAFDTTALALVFSIVLMFALFFVERVETQLLRIVDQRAQSEVDAHFDFVGAANEPNTLLRSWGRRMLAATRRAVLEQTELWRDSMRNAEHSWCNQREALSHDLQKELSTSLRDGLSSFAEVLGKTSEQADQRLAQRWQQWQTMLSETARQLENRQQLTVRQAETVSEILSRLEGLNSIQQAVDRNLEALASTSRLDHALVGLTQAVGRLREDLRLERAAAKQSTLGKSPAAGDDRRTASDDRGAAASDSATTRQLVKPFRIRIAEATRRAA